MGKEEPFRSLRAPHHGPEPKVLDAELQKLRQQHEIHTSDRVLHWKVWVLGGFVG